MDKLMSNTILQRKDLITVNAYTRNEKTKKKEVPVVIEKLMRNYYHIIEKNFMELFNPIQIESKLCKGKNYRITKCFMLSDWRDGFKLILLPRDSLKYKFVANFHLTHGQYSLHYIRESKKQTDFCVRKKNFVNYDKVPQNGQRILIKVQMGKEICNEKHILDVTICDYHHVALAGLTIQLKGKSIDGQSLYLEWEQQSDEETTNTSYEANILNNPTLPIVPEHDQTFFKGYSNGILLIEKYAKVHQNDKLKSQFRLRDYALFTYDYIVREY